MTLLFIPALIIGLPAYIIWRAVRASRERRDPLSWQPKAKANQPGWPPRGPWEPK